jgi:hypothetical protein
MELDRVLNGDDHFLRDEIMFRQGRRRFSVWVFFRFLVWRLYASVISALLTLFPFFPSTCYSHPLIGGDTAHVTGKKSSIWGDEVTFPDEFHPNNLHDRRGRLSMANRGPNSNKVSKKLLAPCHPSSGIALLCMIGYNE